MQNSRKLFTALKLQLKIRGMTYKTLAEKVGLSEASIKRIFSEQNCGLDRFENLCEASGCEFFDLIQKSRQIDGPTCLTREQEEFLVERPLRFVVFYLIYRNWAMKDIMSRCSLEAKGMERILLDFDKQRLIELESNLKVKLLVPRTLMWIHDGPVFQMFQSQVKAEFLSAPFTAEHASFHFVSGEVSENTRRIIDKRLQEWLKELHRLMDFDADLAKDQTESVGLVLAFRPWTFSLFDPITP